MNIAAPMVAAVALLVAAEDWPHWRGPRSDGTWNAPKLPQRWPADGLKPVWKQPVGGGYSAIIVADGRVYTMDREKLPKSAKDEADAPDGYERILCYEAANGQPLWTHKYPTRYGNLDYPNGPRSAPTVHDGRVYALGAVGHLHCCDAVSGKVLWAKDLVKEHRARIPMWGLAASPVIDDDRIIIHCGAAPDGCVMAFHRVTGAEIWRSLPDPAGYCTPILIDAPSGRQLVVWTPENIRGLEPRTGKLLWTVPYKITYGVSIATPIFRENILFVAGYWDGGKAIRLGPKATDAELLWEDNQHTHGLMAQPLYRDGYVYSIDKSLGMVCFELKTGRKIWDDHRLTPRGRNPHASIVWVNDGNRVLILNSAGELILAHLNPTGYEEDSRTKLLGGEVWGHPAFAGNCIFARSDGAEQSARAGPFELVCVQLTDK
jgi:outer membrane protein assembly factor BamB